MFFLAVSCAPAELKFYAKTDMGTTEVKIRKVDSHNIYNIAYLAFGDNFSYNLAVIKAEDTLGSTYKAISKIEVEKKSWPYYDMKNGSVVHYYHQRTQ
jgi:hypothetical protein